MTRTTSPLAEGRELKLGAVVPASCSVTSPLAEGRELKYRRSGAGRTAVQSPLAEGRELKSSCVTPFFLRPSSRPSRRGVN